MVLICIMMSLLIFKTNESRILFLVVLFPVVDVFVNQTAINANHTSKQINAQFTVGHLVLSELVHCKVIHMELVSLEERDHVGVHSHLGQN